MGALSCEQECIQNPNPLFRLEILVNKRDPTFKMKWNLYYYFKNYFYKQTNNMQWIFIFHTSIKKKPVVLISFHVRC